MQDIEKQVEMCADEVASAMKRMLDKIAENRSLKTNDLGVHKREVHFNVLFFTANDCFLNSYYLKPL